MWPAVATIAFASVFSYPDEGSEPMGRAGAWVARASDPIAIARNPAGLAGQSLRMSAGWDLPIRNTCVGDICDTASPFPVGFLAINLPATPRLSIGTGVVTPHGIARMQSPLLDSMTFFIIPTFGLAYEIADGVKIGASFGWGMATTRTVSRLPTIYGAYDVTVLANDFFVPRGTVGAHARANDYVEAGASFMLSAPFDGAGQGRASAVTYVDHRWYPKTDFEVTIPAEASLGVRVRAPRGSAPQVGPKGEKVDPIDSELGDVELDATWSNDAAIDGYGRRFRNVVGFRLGGDLNVIPGALAIRAGGFIIPRAGEPGFVAIESMSGTRVGLSAGMTARIDKRFDLSLAYLHVFIGDVGAVRDGLDVMHLGVAYRF